MDRDYDFVAMARERLIYGVVNNLENHVMEPRAVRGIADIHTRAFSDGIKAFEYPNALGIIRGIIWLVTLV